MGGPILTLSLAGYEQPPFVVAQSESRDLDELLEEHTAWVVLPRHTVAPPSPLPELVRRVRNLTGWSMRELGLVIGTSHTTVRMLETNGRTTARSREPAARIRPLLGVLSRLARLTDSPQALALALETATDTGEKAIDHLTSGDWAKAFLLSLNVINGPRPDMLTPSQEWPVSPATREMP